MAPVALDEHVSRHCKLEGMFAATPIEYRLRFALHGLVYTLGFVPLWQLWLGFPLKSVWLLGSATIARQGWMPFQSATVALLIAAIVLTGLGMGLRLWGAAYIGASVVKSPSMHGETLLADGPYRRSRNPLYLGTFLHTLGIALLMPPAGAVLTVVLIGVLQVRLALAEEPFLTARLGAPYLAYKAAVPRFLPSPRPRVPAAGTQPQWRMALAGEIYVVGVFLTIVCLGWSFNATPMIQGILISLGVSLVIRALLPKAGNREQENRDEEYHTRGSL